ADVEERPRLLALAHLDQALAVVEGHVRQRADRDRERRILAPLGGVDHHVGHADQLLLDRGRRSLLLGHGGVLPSLACGGPGLRARLGRSLTSRAPGALRPVAASARRRAAVRLGDAVRRPRRRRVGDRRGHLALDALGRHDDRVRQAFGAASILPQELVGLFAAGPLPGHLLELVLQLRGGQLAALETVARRDDFLDVELEDVAPAELAVGALAPPEERAEPPAALAQRQRDLLANLVVLGDRFLGLAGERDPDRRH